MKIYSNDLCPCGSGKMYKECCMKKNVNQVGNIGFLPVDEAKENADFIVNRKGAIVFKDESKQPTLEIPEGFIIKTVLSVGFSGTHKPMVTVLENEGAVCYILPNLYLDWCETCVGLAMHGTNLFPSNVVFSLNKGKYSADIL